MSDSTTARPLIDATQPMRCIEVTAPQPVSAPTGLPRFIAFGEALTDFVRTDDHTWRSVAGGACWNVARVAASLGVASAWAGAVSYDLFGDDIVKQSVSAGLDTRFLQRAAKPPLLAIVHQTHPPDYFFIGNDSADLAFDPEQLPDGWRSVCEWAHFGCISLVRQPLGAVLTQLAMDLKRCGTRISYDPNVRNLMGPHFYQQFEQFATIADILKVSDEDLAQIYPNRSPNNAMAYVRALAPQADILYTRGAHGMTLHRSDGTRLERASFRVAVVDTVGAGDSCLGAYIASLLRDSSGSPADHLRFAAAAAAIVCAHAGAHAPTVDEIDRLQESD